MKTGAIAVFVKTPGISSVKTRLGEGIGRVRAERFYQLSCYMVGAVARRAAAEEKRIKITPYWAVAEAAGMNSTVWTDQDKITQGEGTLGERMSRVYDALLAKHDCALMVSGDSPQLTPRLLVDAIGVLYGGAPYIMGTVEDGGFYLFGGQAPVKREVWTSVPYSDWQTAEIFKQKLSSTGRVAEVTHSFDTDSVEDLGRAKKFLSSRQDLLPEQKIMMEWLKKEFGG